ncbi:POK6 protein, partial [Certhia familiaris]|nr:POK6 protein [Certhia familiaris]
MGALQPGMPSPAMLPQNWHLLIIDLKDCFFTIPLQKEDTIKAAQESHSLFHQAAKALHRQFKITWTDAKGIVCTCPQCSYHGSGLSLGVNPRGLQSCEIWQ